jgi:hypothetical protein
MFVVFLESAKIHTSAKMREFYLDKKDVLKRIFMQRYSPNMNPQENIWNYPKAKLYKPSSRISIEEHILYVKDIFDELNSDVDKIHSLFYARRFIV